MEHTDTTTADIARVARIRLARAHDAAIGRSTDGPWVTLVYGFWGIASEAAYQLGLA